MDGERIHVRNVRGRYPDQPAIMLDSDNIEARVAEEARIVRIRLDDAENPDFWLEITLELER